MADLSADLPAVFHIDISSPSTSSSTSRSSSPTHSRRQKDRTAQSPAAFEHVRAHYRPRLENGEIHMTLPRHVRELVNLYAGKGEDAEEEEGEKRELLQNMKQPQKQKNTQKKVAKPDAAILVHAVEELYFFRRYVEAVALARCLLEQNTESPTGKQNHQRDSNDVDDGSANRVTGNDSEGLLDYETVALLRKYESMCLSRANSVDLLEHEKLMHGHNKVMVNE